MFSCHLVFLVTPIVTHGGAYGQHWILAETVAAGDGFVCRIHDAPWQWGPDEWSALNLASALWLALGEPGVREEIEEGLRKSAAARA